jgi:hypothetical protein
MFSILNPSGNVPDSSWYRTLLIVCAIVPVLVTAKRYYTGILQGRRLYNRYGEELSRVMERTLLINKVGKLARDIETMGLRFDNFDFRVDDYQRTESTELEPSPQEEPGLDDEDEDGTAGLDLFKQGFFNTSMRAKLNELLGEWEEPESERDKEVSVVWSTLSPAQNWRINPLTVQPSNRTLPTSAISSSFASHYST